LELPIVTLFQQPKDFRLIEDMVGYFSGKVPRQKQQLLSGLPSHSNGAVASAPVVIHIFGGFQIAAVGGFQ